MINIITVPTHHNVKKTQFQFIRLKTKHYFKLLQTVTLHLENVEIDKL